MRYFGRPVCRALKVSVDSLKRIRIQVARPGYMLPGDMCPDVNARHYN